MIMFDDLEENQTRSPLSTPSFATRRVGSRPLHRLVESRGSLVESSGCDQA